VPANGRRRCQICWHATARLQTPLGRGDQSHGTGHAPTSAICLNNCAWLHLHMVPYTTYYTHFVRPNDFFQRHKPIEFPLLRHHFWISTAAIQLQIVVSLYGTWLCCERVQFLVTILSLQRQCKAVRRGERVWPLRWPQKARDTHHIQRVSHTPDTGECNYYLRVTESAWRCFDSWWLRRFTAAQTRTSHRPLASNGTPATCAHCTHAYSW